jgi:hypothetical protein
MLAFSKEMIVSSREMDTIWQITLGKCALKHADTKDIYISTCLIVSYSLAEICALRVANNTRVCRFTDNNIYQIAVGHA